MVLGAEVLRPAWESTRTSKAAACARAASLLGTCGAKLPKLLTEQLWVKPVQHRTLSRGGCGRAELWLNSNDDKLTRLFPAWLRPSAGEVTQRKPGTASTYTSGCEPPRGLAQGPTALTVRHPTATGFSEVTVFSLSATPLEAAAVALCSASALQCGV